MADIQGIKKITSSNNSLNAIKLWWDIASLDVNTMLPVKVIAIDTVKDLIDVQVMINGINANGESIQGVKIYNCPYLKTQASNSGFVITPKIGDIGAMVFSQRDLTRLIQYKQAQTPETLRRFSLSDGIYLFTFISQAELTNFINLDDNKIQIQSNSSINIKSKTTMDIDSNTSLVINALNLKLQANNQNLGQVLADLFQTMLINAPTFAPEGILNPVITTALTQALIKLGGFQ